MNFNIISDKIVFSALKHIKYGRINLTNYDGSKIIFGKDNNFLRANLKINNPNLLRKMANFHI